MAVDLDEIDKRIIYELDRNCRLPETRLAKIIGKSKEAVRYRVRKLRESGVIKGFGTRVNLTKLGFEAPKIYLRTREKKALMDSFISHLRKRPDVFWIGKGDGAWNVGITFFAKDNLDFFWIKNELFSTYRELVVEQVVGSIVENYTFGMKFLLGENTNVPAVRYLGAKEQGNVDKIDRDILGCLLLDGRMPYSTIASKVGCAPESVRSRVKDMERKSIISTHALVVDYKKMGFEFYKTYLYFEGLSKAHEKRLFEIARRHPNVINYLTVLAPWDVELEIMAENYHHYNEIANYFREQFSDVLVNVQSTALDLDVLFPSGKLPKLPCPYTRARP